jgi:hypothetical protein
MPRSPTTAKPRAGARPGDSNSAVNGNGHRATNGSSVASKRPVAAISLPTSAQIAQRAFEIYEREGRPEGKHVEHWLQAEQELRGQAPE